MFSLMDGHPRGYLTTFSFLKQHSSGHMITFSAFYPPYRDPRGYVLFKYGGTRGSNCLPSTPESISVFDYASNLYVIIK